jgi:hypothetical protein
MTRPGSVISCRINDRLPARSTAHALQLQRPADVVATIQKLLDNRA